MQSFPNFPHFRALTLSDRSVYEEFYKKFDPYSDFSFNNLWVWFGANNALAIARNNNFLVIQIGDPFHGGTRSYTVIGKGNPSQTIQRIFRWQKAMLLPQRLVMVPEVVVAGFRSPLITIEEDEDNKDYIYDVSLMHKKLGNQYVKYRHALHYFASHYDVELEVRTLDLESREQRIKLINALHSWDSSYHQEQQAQLEGAAIDKLLRDCDSLPVNGLGLYIDSKLASFSLYQLPPHDGVTYAIVNHLKCDNNYNYLFDVTVSKIIAVLHDKSIAFVNLEQDLGLAGLRTHKERLHPCTYLRRYTLTPR